MILRRREEVTLHLQSVVTHEHLDGEEENRIGRAVGIDDLTDCLKSD